MGEDTVSKGTRVGRGAQSLKSFSLCTLLLTALAGVFWYGGTRAESPPQPFLSSPLVQAMHSRDRAALVRELDRLPSVDTPDEEGMTALLTAACCGDVEDLKCVLARGPDLNRVQRAYGSPLMAVLVRRDAAAARLLLQRGADPGRLAPDGDCALLAAIRGGSDECIDLIVAAVQRRGDDLFPPGMLENPLSCAASDDDQTPVIRRLLAMGVDPNRAGSNGQLPLVTALLCNAPRSASLLLGAGANPDLPDGRGRVARALAATDGRLAAAYLPATGAHVQAGRPRL
jgi:ankyrin repeat protein